MPTQTSTIVGVVQAMGFLQLFGASLSSRVLADGFELEGYYHGVNAHAIRTFDTRASFIFFDVSGTFAFQNSLPEKL